MPESLILLLSDHRTFSQAISESFRSLLAILRCACTCTSLNRRTSQVLQDFNSLSCSVLSMVFNGDHSPKCFHINNKLLCNFGLIHHFSHDDPQPTNQDFEWSSKPRVTLYFFHFRIIAPTVVTFWSSFLMIILQPTSDLCRSIIKSKTSLFLSCLWFAHGSEEVGTEETDYIMWTICLI